MRYKKKKNQTRNKTRKYVKRRGGGEDSIPICIYSHSSVFDVLHINIEYLEKLFKDTSQPIYLFTDKPYDKETTLRVTSLIYKDDLAYNKRLVHCINQVAQPYMILSHESDVLLKYDASTVSKIKNTMRSNNIDSVELTANRGKCDESNILNISPTLSLVDIKSFEYTYNSQPRLWKTASAKELYESTTEKSYKQSENVNVQRYVKSNHNTYGVCCSDSIKTYGIYGDKVDPYFDVSPAYTFLHLTRAGKFITRITDKDNGKVDPFIIQTQKDIYDTYCKKSERKIE